MSSSKNPFNGPVANVQYSFPKAPRLPKLKNQDVSFYTLPSTIDHRSASMGFGKKTQIARNYNTPSPDHYHKTSTFTRSAKKGMSFGLGREQIKAIKLIPEIQTPGPGAYENILKDSSKNYSMRGRDGFPDIFAKSNVPGVGKYELNQDIVKGRYCDSHKKNPQNFTIPPEHKERENKFGEFEIGPGKYEIGYNSIGKQFLGNKKTESSFLFGKENRNFFEQTNKNPGPGSYSFASEFKN